VSRDVPSVCLNLYDQVKVQGVHSAGATRDSYFTEDCKVRKCTQEQRLWVDGWTRKVHNMSLNRYGQMKARGVHDEAARQGYFTENSERE